MDKGLGTHIRRVNVLFFQELRLLGNNIHQSDDFAPLGKIPAGLDMGIDDPSCSDNGNLEYSSKNYLTCQLSGGPR